MAIGLKRFSPLSKSSVSVVALVVTLSACGIVKNMDEMHDATVEMNNKMTRTNQGLEATRDKMGSLSGQLDSANGRIDQTNTRLDSTYFGLRQSNTKLNRTNALTDMERATSPDGKAAAAGFYYMAMEYQLWQNFGPDTDERRVELYAEAMQELFLVMQNYKEYSRPIDPGSTNPKMLNLGALSLAIHLTNPNELREPKTQKLVSTLSLIEETLRQKNRMMSMEAAERERIPEYQKEILANEEDAVYLLQLRANFLAAAVLSKISDVQEGGFKGTVLKAEMYLRPWDAQLSQLNTEQLDKCRFYMTEAVRVTDELTSLGYSPRLDPKLMRVYRNMRFDSSTASVKSIQFSSQAQLAAQGLGAEIDLFRATSSR